jgi:hypothetical protein
LNFRKKIRFWFEVFWSYFEKVAKEKIKQKRNKKETKKGEKALGSQSGLAPVSAHGPAPLFPEAVRCCPSSSR